MWFKCLKQDLWIEKNKDQGTPLLQWYARYKTMREREIMMEISNKDNVCHFNFRIYSNERTINYFFDFKRFPRIKYRK